MQDDLEKYRRMNSELFEGCAWIELVYADDMTLVLASKCPDKLTVATEANATNE